MKKNTLVALVFALLCALLTSLFPSVSTAQEPRGEKIGLLVIFHGSGNPKWFEQAARWSERVVELNRREKAFYAVSCVNMETEDGKDVAYGVEELEKAGCDFIAAVPALVFPTGHALVDVPALLGVSGNPLTRRDLQAEGMRLARTRLPISIGGTLADGDLLKDYVVDQTRSISKAPGKERVLIVAHGNGSFQGLVDRYAAPIVEAVEAMGYDRVDAVFVGMGETFADDALPIVKENTQDGMKTLVVAVYLAHAGKDFLKDVEKQERISLEGLDWIGNETKLGDYEKTPAFILKQGIEASRF